MTTDQQKDHWYYDACMLERKKSDYGEMFRSHNPIIPILSHLSLGEAFAGAYRKGPEKLEAFVALIESLRLFIFVVENDGKSKLLEDIKENFELSDTDAMHLATAISNGCVCIRTIDPDFVGLNQKILYDFGRKYGLPRLSVNNKSYANNY